MSRRMFRTIARSRGLIATRLIDHALEAIWQSYLVGPQLLERKTGHLVIFGDCLTESESVLLNPVQGLTDSTSVYAPGRSANFVRLSHKKRKTSSERIESKRTLE
jgi:hypothetical protein